MLQFPDHFISVPLLPCLHFEISATKLNVLKGNCGCLCRLRRPGREDVTNENKQGEEGDEEFEPEDQGISDYLEGKGCVASTLYRRDASGEERARRNPTAKDVVIRVELRRDFGKGDAKDEKGNGDSDE